MVKVRREKVRRKAEEAPAAVPTAGSGASSKKIKMEVAPEVPATKSLHSSGTKKQMQHAAGPSPVAVMLSKGEMRQLLKDTSACEFAAPFLDPVDTDSAPGYLDVVDTPMALETVKLNLRGGLYDVNSDLFVSHMRLIRSNCLTYNDPLSDIAKWAERLGHYFEGQLKTVLDSKKGAVSSSSEQAGHKPSQLQPAGEEEETKASRPTVSAVLRKLKKIWKDVSAHPLAEPFKYPIDLDQAPGYAEAIRTPMDLSTVKSRMATTYEEAPGKFLRDMRLIFDNCQTYNVEQSQFWVAAGELRGLTDRLFSEAFPAATGEETKAPRSTHKTKQTVGNEAHGLELSGTTVQASMSGVASTKVPSKTQAAAASRPKSVAQVEEMLASLRDPASNLAANPLVRERASNSAAELLRNTKLPFVVAPTLYEVASFGEVFSDWANTYSASSVHPVGYACSRSLRICVIPEGSSTPDSAPLPFVSVDLKSVISTAAGEERCKYLVTLQNGTVVAAGDTPREAWDAVFGRELQTLRSLGSKMERCRAVFNRLCVSPDSTDFLEQVPVNSEEGAQYYRTIPAPMWLREVHSRLVSGTYDNEFDFAWDMRLIFRNCMEYNASGSHVYHSAQRASVVFEHLYLNWVVNVQDRAVDDLAQGLWRDWDHIRYFDSADPAENLCAISGERGGVEREAEFVQCQWCEDQNLRTIAGVAANRVKWVCMRCTRALEHCDGDLKGPPLLSLLNVQKSVDMLYSCEEFGGNIFVPAADLGVGWCHARRRRLGGLKNLYLSPLGYEVTREMVAAQEEYETGINRDLTVARAKEFQDQLDAAKTAATKGKNSKQKPAPSVRHTRHSRVAVASPQSKAEPEESSAAAALLAEISAAKGAPVNLDGLEEEGRISTGKLSRFEVPPGHRLAWFSCADEAAVLECFRGGGDVAAMLESRTELSGDKFSADGFFGLSLHEVRSRIEGLEGVSACRFYEYQDSAAVATALISELEVDKERFSAFADGEARLRRSVLDERWHWDMARLYPWTWRPTMSPALTTTSRDGGGSGENKMDTDDDGHQLTTTVATEHKAGFAALFPDAHLQHGCTVLAVWDFLDAAKHWMGVPVFSLQDLTRSLDRPQTALTTTGQVVFDEMCCMLAEMLLQETRVRAEMGPDQERDWQDVLFVKPVNIITWPQIALDALRILAFPFSPTEARQMVGGRSLSAEMSLQNDFLVLLFSHPALDVFLFGRTFESPVTQSAHEQVRKTILNFRESFCFAATGFTHIQQQNGEDNTPAPVAGLSVVLQTLHDIFLRVVDSAEVEEAVRLPVQHLLQWLQSVSLKFGVELSGTSTVAPNNSTAEPPTSAATNYKRFWGSYFLSNSDIAREQVLTSHSFDNFAEFRSEYALKLRALADLESTLFLLRSTEPDAFSSEERATLYRALLDQCYVSKAFAFSTRARQTRVRSMLSEYAEAQGSFTTFPESLPVNSLESVRFSGKSGVRCHYTDIAMRNSFESHKWVVVPQELTDLPLKRMRKAEEAAAAAAHPADATAAAREGLPLAQQESGVYHFRGGSSRSTHHESSAHAEDGKAAAPVAVLSAVLRVAHARDAAKIQKMRFDVRNTLI